MDNWGHCLKEEDQFAVYLATAAAGPGSGAAGTAVQVVPILTAQALQQPPKVDEGKSENSSELFLGRGKNPNFNSSLADR